MNAEEARHVDAVLRHLGLPGVVAPEDPENPAGVWRVYDRADPEKRTDTTADALVSLAKAFRRESRASASEPAQDEQKGPTRGFVIPPTDD
ncbi:hypothetical protein [Streptomyces litchfieldiae]|uniref:Uncharacterized protein n=1 Tax=Streptomyces litchfieldiae TaxID=3075543 RepID=A0ABU2MJE5_9ACTN|nr:hypothetical protein [Streptomyces sp. DSM 44938]MDT0341488.1 hypothetical protein [Streptomyces sp. DSM 44938]